MNAQPDDDRPEPFEAVFQGGPLDGEHFTHTGMAIIETAEVDEVSLWINEYQAVDGTRTVYRHTHRRHQATLADIREHQRRALLDHDDVSRA